MATKWVTIKTRVTTSRADRFARLARRNGRSVAEELRRAVDAHLDSHDAPTDRKDGR